MAVSSSGSPIGSFPWEGVRRLRGRAVVCLIRGFSAHRVVASAVAVLLFAGGALKLLDSRVWWGAASFDRLAVWAAIEAEFVVGSWLLSAYRAAIVFRVALLLFWIFFLVSVFKALEGVKSCGCFGAFDVPPLAAAIVDLTIICLLIRYSPQEVVRDARRVRQWRRFATPALAIVAFQVAAGLRERPLPVQRCLANGQRGRL